MDQQIEHVVALSANLQPSFDPVELRSFEELRLTKRAEKVLLLQPFRCFLVQLVQDVALQQLLIRHPDLDWVRWWAVLLEPRIDQRNVYAPAREARPHVEGARCPVQSDCTCSIFVEEWRAGEQRFHISCEYKLLAIPKVVIIQGFACVHPRGMRGDRIDDRIEVEGGHVRVLCLDIAACWLMVFREPHIARTRVVEERKCELVLGANGLADDDLVDIIELIPVIIVLLQIAMQRLELRSSWNSHIQGLGRNEGVHVEEVEVILIA
mmetsp:Transcript_13648/g.34058  ORF Transcript_13648/g.34058 Transcript_13648/m.34058 type:complete len:266 (-) Transcript_13648:916-1713(-)